MEIIGHDEQKKILEEFVRSVGAGEAREHAFIFSGVAEIGKRTLAMRTAEALIAQRPPVWQADSQTSVTGDLILVAPLQEKKSVKGKEQLRIKDISVTQIRSMRQKLSLAADGAARVVIIDDAERLTVQAANALLKLLEEPPKNTYFFVISSDVKCLPETIISRARTMQFVALNLAQFSAAGYGDEDAYVRAMGRVGRAERLRGDSDFAEETSVALETLTALRTMHTHERLKCAEDLATDAQRCQWVLALWATKIRSVAAHHGRYELLMLVEKIENVRFTIKTTNTNRRLALENLVVAL